MKLKDVKGIKGKEDVDSNHCSVTVATVLGYSVEATVSDTVSQATNLRLLQYSLRYHALEQ